MKKIFAIVAAFLMVAIVLSVTVFAYQHAIDSAGGVTFGGTLYTSSSAFNDSAYSSTSRNSTSYPAQISASVTIYPYNTAQSSVSASASSPLDGNQIVTTATVSLTNAASASSSHSMTIVKDGVTYNGSFSLNEDM